MRAYFVSMTRWVPEVPSVSGGPARLPVLPLLPHSLADASGLEVAAEIELSFGII